MICNKLKDCVEAHFTGCADGISCVNDETLCIESFDKRPQVKCEEKGKKYIYHNTKSLEVINYQMDGGVIKPDNTVSPMTQRCDNVIVAKDNSQNAIFVELKGEDVPHALEQLLGTVLRENELVKVCERIYARIIMTCAVPRIQTTKEYKVLQKIILSKGGNIKLHTRQWVEKDTDLDVG